MSTPPSTRTLIEQAVARGETLDWICDNLNVTPRAVDAALARMEQLLTEDVARPGRGGVPLAPIRHGTHTGFNTHKARSDQPCMQCVDGERKYQAARMRRWRKKAAA